MHHRLHIRDRSIFRRILALFLVTLLLQTLINLFVYIQGGVLSKAEENAYRIFLEKTASRKVYLENEMVDRWSNLQEAERHILTLFQTLLEEEHRPSSDLTGNPELARQAVAQAAPLLVELLRRNSVSGAFLILDAPVSGDPDAYPGVFVRDYDPSGYAEDNEDLLLQQGLPAIARSLSLAMDSYWSAHFSFPEPQAEWAQFFFAPLMSARQADPERRNSSYFSYWSTPFSLHENARSQFSCSIPLILDDGTVVGVLGTSISLDYLATQLPYGELDESRAGIYALGITHDGGATYELVQTSGPTYQTWFGQSRMLTTRQGPYENIVLLERDAPSGTSFYGAVQPLRLYDSNTPFQSDQWALIGILNETHLLTFSQQLKTMIFLSTAISLVAGIFLVALAARSITKPVSSLVTELRQSDPTKPIKLRRTYISEIDTLSSAVESLSNSAVEAAARVSKIISMTHLPVGVFEYSHDGDYVFCSSTLFPILGWPERPREDVQMPQNLFFQRLTQATAQCADPQLQIYELNDREGGQRWVQLFSSQEGSGQLGVFQDVTPEIQRKQRMEHERDYDVLTELYNRRAFDTQIKQLLAPEHADHLQTSALLMFDLDNLKFVNDSYGHDYGDRYIKAFAQAISFFPANQKLVGRRSGDEFNVFLYGFSDREALRQCVASFWSLTVQQEILLPSGDPLRVRASGGLAWFPDDADSYGELLRLADFAMYDSKHTHKGIIKEFDRETYATQAILIQGQNALNQLIDLRLVRYAFQPIVSVQQGDIMGYALLMRPMVSQLSNLDDLFRLARSQSKLYPLEQLTWFESIEAFARQVRAGRIGSETRAFINSIGGQILTDQDTHTLETNYPDLLHRLVLEITEGEGLDLSLSRQKMEWITGHGGLLAIDDFGSGYNSDTTLIQLSPNIVKVDLSIIRGIHADAGRQEILRNLISYSRPRGIQVLAEGIETREELETVLSLGVDLLQGFYLGRPDFLPRPLSEEVRAKLLAARPL